MGYALREMFSLPRTNAMMSISNERRSSMDGRTNAIRRRDSGLKTGIRRVYVGCHGHCCLVPVTSSHVVLPPLHVRPFNIETRNLGSLFMMIKPLLQVEHMLCNNEIRLVCKPILLLICQVKFDTR